MTAGLSELQRMQRRRKLQILSVALVLAPLSLVVGSAWPSEGMVGEAIRAVGALLIVVAICGRTWCTLYIGGRKREALVTEGPYSVMRHPLYTFTIIGILGLGAQTGSILAALTLAAASGWPLLAVARHEENVLFEAFGEDYRAYHARTPASCLRRGYGARRKGWTFVPSSCGEPSWRPPSSCSPCPWPSSSTRRNRAECCPCWHGSREDKRRGRARAPCGAGRAGPSSSPWNGTGNAAHRGRLGHQQLQGLPLRPDGAVAETRQAAAGILTVADRASRRSSAVRSATGWAPEPRSFFRA